MKQKKPTLQELTQMYQVMVRIREFEQQASSCFLKGKLAGNIHLSIGQEAVAAGAISGLNPDDYITSTHRGHGHCLAKGGQAKYMMAELFGKATGYCRGKGGSMHIAEVRELRCLGANGIVGAGIPIATGSALASKIFQDSLVTLCFFGDGASNQGTFHESVNMAATWKLPIVYLCENNGYGVSTDIHRVVNVQNLSIRARGYEIPGITVDGTDAVEVCEAVRTAAARARAGNGPTLVECLTYRFQGHYCGDPASYRSASYLEEAKQNDPIDKMRSRLLAAEMSEKEIDAINAAAVEEMIDAVAYAEHASYPDLIEVTSDVYAIDNERSVLR